MTTQRIKVAVDPRLASAGDVVIIKRTFFDPLSPTKLRTICTRCEGLFPAQLRRMERLDSDGKRRCEVRNVPQCPPCRSRYGKTPLFAGVPVATVPAHEDHSHDIARAENEGMPS